MGVPVRVTLGRPPRWFAYPHEHVSQLAPPPQVFHLADSDWQAFRRAYRHKLHRTTPQRLQRVFDDLSRKHGDRRLVLLCFEADPADCHRGLFAEWWHQQTQEHVPELRPSGETKRQDGPRPGP